jgi:hypothetical protein
MADPRQAKTLVEAALNPDGTWNGPRALSWMSAALGGKGFSEEETRAIFAEAVARAKARKKGEEAQK